MGPCLDSLPCGRPSTWSFPHEGVHQFRGPATVGDPPGEARREGAVRIRRRDGQILILRPDTRTGSPLDVPPL